MLKPLMNKSMFWLSLITVLLWNQAAAAADKPKLEVLSGPAKAPLSDIAAIDIPKGYEFLDGTSTRSYLEAIGEPTSGHELGLLSPTNENWSVFFEFSEVGYVKDDDKNKLDPDGLMKSIRKGTEEGNKIRAKAGQPPLTIVGWEVKPHYDEKTHHLEWAIRAESAGRAILNYNTRLLGRKGVMEVVLVVSPEDLQATLPTFRNLLNGYTYQSGQSYAEFRQGDKVAKYGLAALVVGGTAVGAAKLGLFAALGAFLKKGWKLVVIGIAALAAAIKKIFSGRTTHVE